MKTVKQGGEVKRVSDSDAQVMINKGGWVYCPKSEWKSKVRNAGKVSEEEKFSKVNSKSDKSDKSGDKNERRTKKEEKAAGKEKSKKRQSKYHKKKETADG